MALLYQSLVTPKIKKHEPNAPSIYDDLSGDYELKLCDAMNKEIKAIVARGTWKEVRK